MFQIGCLVLGKGLGGYSFRRVPRLASIQQAKTNFEIDHGLMARRCFPVAKIGSSSLPGIVF